MRIMGNYQTELAFILKYVSKGKMAMNKKEKLNQLAKITDGRIKFGLCVDLFAIYDCNMQHLGNNAIAACPIKTADYGYKLAGITCPVEIKITAANVALIKAGARRWVRLSLKLARELIAACGHSFVLGTL